jgi:hypothetical protein
VRNEIAYASPFVPICRSDAKQQQNRPWEPNSFDCLNARGNGGQPFSPATRAVPLKRFPPDWNDPTEPKTL